MIDKSECPVLVNLNPVRRLLVTRRRREVLLALTAASMLVQLSSLPVALSLPTLAKYFESSIDEVAWIIIIYLLMLGSLVLISARLGDRYGHVRLFFIGILASTASSAMIAFSQELWQMVFWRGLTGLGAALIMGNFNAILADTFPPEERGRAFAIPIIGARFGTLTGLAVFGLFLHFIGWRPVFIAFLPLGLLATVASIPLLLHHQQEQAVDISDSVDWLGGALLVGAFVVLILSGSHLHGGEETYVSSEGLQYHLPMHLIFLSLVGFFVLVERRIRNPMIDLKHFRQRPFSLSLASNVTYHFSMLATMTLVPVLVEEGFGRSPLFVTVVLLPSQILGLFMPLVSGWIFDKYRPKLLRPMTMVVIAGGFLAIGLSTPHVSFWFVPLLMLPISIGTNMFNPINNATVMNSLALEHRGVASGMLETTREIGHALGATAAASVLAISLPETIGMLSEEASQQFFIHGFRLSSLMVVFVLLFGATLAFLHREPVSPVVSDSVTARSSYQRSAGD